MARVAPWLQWLGVLAVLVGVALVVPWRVAVLVDGVLLAALGVAVELSWSPRRDGE